MHGSVVFARWRLWAPTEHMLPWAHQSPSPTLYLDRFSGFAQLTVTAERPYTLQGAAPPSELPLPVS